MPFAAVLVQGKRPGSCLFGSPVACCSFPTGKDPNDGRLSRNTEKARCVRLCWKMLYPVHTFQSHLSLVTEPLPTHYQRNRDEPWQPCWRLPTLLPFQAWSYLDAYCLLPSFAHPSTSVFYLKVYASTTYRPCSLLGRPWLKQTTNGCAGRCWLAWLCKRTRGHG